ncbi:hypothetical protein V8G54_009769 [Vigna mungo]|uniref:Uncharacterized protein n=1 Tax=Vigna mungo TaxID=3915 RepID=A0AAQ3S482_VIGMU
MKKVTLLEDEERRVREVVVGAGEDDEAWLHVEAYSVTVDEQEEPTVCIQLHHYRIRIHHEEEERPPVYPVTPLTYPVTAFKKKKNVLSGYSIHLSGYSHEEEEAE